MPAISKAWAWHAHKFYSVLDQASLEVTLFLAMAFHVPSEETLDRLGLELLQREKLAALLDAVLSSNPFYRRKLAGIRFDPTRDPIDRFPLTTRSEIEQDQATHPPFGTNLSYNPVGYNRFHQTSGTTGQPIRWLDTAESWEWFKGCWCIVYRGAGVTSEDRLAFPFSFGPFIGFWAAFEAAASLGNLCLPAGGMTTTARLRYILDNGVTVVCCTPTYALRMAQTAAAEGLDLRSSAVRLVIVAGEPGGSVPSVRSRIESAWGARVIDHAGMTEVGAWGFECVEAPGGMHVIESEFLAEVIDPVSGQPLAEGETGELVLTNLGRIGSPVIRYRTGDQVRATRAHCACGRFFLRLEGGILGRLDSMLIVRGNNVFPSAIEAILHEFDEVAEFRVVVEERAGMTELRLELEPAASASSTGLAERIAMTIRDRLHFRPEVSLVKAGALPRFEMKAKRVLHTTNRPAQS